MDTQFVSRQYKLTSYSTGRDWMFGFPTATIDRFSPDVEEVYLPAAVSLDGELRLELDLGGFGVSKSATQPRLERLKSLVSDQTLELDSSQIVLDMRINSPQNWAHAITNHLALSLLIKDLLKDIDKKLVVIFPANISSKILDVFRLSGFSCQATDSGVKGYICKFSLSPWISIRGERCEVIRSGLKSTELVAQVEASEIKEDKIFLSRRDKRTITNESEVVDYLEARGFKTLYAEDYTPIEQIAYIANASQIVSVHGAALGPMIVRSALTEPKNYKLIEIFSPAHVTNVWRMIASQQGAPWAAVRGRVWPELVQDKADFVTNMRNFEVSLDSLQSAISHLEMD